VNLTVPGATLHVEVHGDGPALLLIPGGAGDAGTFQPLGAVLGERTLIRYDRRGFSRSPLAEGALPTRYDDDVEDAARLIDAYAGGRADVLGSSSGAIVALDLLLRHPDKVGTVVAHEAPLTALVPDGPRLRAGFDDVVALLHTAGPEAAMRRFGEVTRIGFRPPPPRDVLPPPVAELLDRIAVNTVFWIEHELHAYSGRELDVEALRPYAARLVLAVGAASTGQFPAEPNRTLAKLLGTEVAEFPGDHNGYVTEPAAFAARLRELPGIALS
jgi:pimeloyl-ACP methyl ester carboxylesterase